MSSSRINVKKKCMSQNFEKSVAYRIWSEHSGVARRHAINGQLFY